MSCWNSTLGVRRWNSHLREIGWTVALNSSKFRSVVLLEAFGTGQKFLHKLLQDWPQSLSVFFLRIRYCFRLEKKKLRLLLDEHVRFRYCMCFCGFKKTEPWFLLPTFAYTGTTASIGMCFSPLDCKVANSHNKQQIQRGLCCTCQVSGRPTISFSRLRA